MLQEELDSWTVSEETEDEMDDVGDDVRGDDERNEDEYDEMDEEGSDGKERDVLFNSRRLRIYILLISSWLS